MLKELFINIHQIIGFNQISLNKKIKGNNIFMPGCSLLSFGKENVEVLYEILKKEVPDMEVVTYCCGKPSKHIYDSKFFNKRIDKIKKHFDKNIYVACPNCYNTLKEEGANIISIWPIIERNIEGSIKEYTGKFSIHDSCTARKNTIDHQAIRGILKKCNIDFVEMKSNREKAICCGKKNMIMALDRKTGEKILNNRLKELETENIISYCASCTETFCNKNIKSYHISHLFTDKKNNYSVINRLKAMIYFIKN